jgi:membrane associated rhomboid family serine protease
MVSPETRALLGLGYPLWPLAALAMLSPRRVPEVQRQALQALGFNFGFFGLYFGLSGLTHIPLLGISAWPLLAVIFPVWLVASVIYGIKVWNGDEVRVPLISDWLDDREQRNERTRVA